MGTSIVDLGRLEKISLRQAWPDEAQNFTPWLAEDTNLALLGEPNSVRVRVVKDWRVIEEWLRKHF